MGEAVSMPDGTLVVGMQRQLGDVDDDHYGRLLDEHAPVIERVGTIKRCSQALDFF